MGRKFSFLMVFLLMLSFIVLSACGDESSSSEGKSKTLKLGTIQTEDSPTTKAAYRFAEIVEEKTNGEIEVQVFPNSQVGGILDMFTGMNSGTVDMMYEGITSYSWIEGAEVFNIFSLPFYWESYEDMIKVLESEEFQTIFDETAEETGVRVIKAIGDTEARQLSANRSVENADDFEGLKIRTAEAKTVQETMKRLGAEPVVIPFSDLYIALQQGTADAQENGFMTVMNNSLYEVQDYVMKTDYIRDVKAWYISNDVWNDLTDEQQEILVEASIEAGELQSELAREQINDALEFLKEEMEYIEPDLESIRAKLGDLALEFEGDLWPEGTYEKVESILNN